MAKLLLFSLVAAVMLMSNKVQSQTTFFDVESWPEPKKLTYQGVFSVPSNGTFVRLANDPMGSIQYNAVGRVLYSQPLQFWEPGKQASFETNIHFRITTRFDNIGDGIVFFIAPVNSKIPRWSYGGNFGIFEPSGVGSSIFAVEFDTYVDPWDPDYRHIGIDIESRDSINVTRFDSLAGQDVRARINYEASSKRITVVATAGSETFEVSYDHFDLKNILPPQVQVGIAASTGGRMASYHDIFSWEFTSTLVDDSHKETYIRQYV